MCLAAFAIGQSDRFPFVLLANRDEAFDRPAAAMAWWPRQAGQPRLLAGRDLAAGGTWLGLTEAGRLAWVTNVREPGHMLPVSPSRGALVPMWLRAGAPWAAEDALQALAEPARNGFNLLYTDLASTAPVHWLSNRPQWQQQAVGHGVHGVSNAALDTPWPKLQQLKQQLAQMLAGAQDLPQLQAAAWHALGDREAADDALLPDTGLPLLRERQLSPVFIRIAGDDPGRAVYGTRCSTLVVLAQAPTPGGVRRSLHVAERSFGPDGAVSAEVRYDWALPAG